MALFPFAKDLCNHQISRPPVDLSLLQKLWTPIKFLWLTILKERSRLSKTTPKSCQVQGHRFQSKSHSSASLKLTSAPWGQGLNSSVPHLEFVPTQLSIRLHPLIHTQRWAAALSLPETDPDQEHSLKCSSYLLPRHPCGSREGFPPVALTPIVHKWRYIIAAALLILLFSLGLFF